MEHFWDRVFRSNSERFGTEPSASAETALQVVAQRHLHAPEMLDLGSGTGRDTLAFAHSGMQVAALDFSSVALAGVRDAADAAGVAQNIRTVQHDVRRKLPFADARFDVCYAHMLYCMDFTVDELAFLAAEVRRILKPGGIHVYTARTTADPDFGVGIHRGEQRYEDEGFTVHFFDRALVERLAAGFRLLAIAEFEEGPLPRRLFTVTLEKTGDLSG